MDDVSDNTRSFALSSYCVFHSSYFTSVSTTPKHISLIKITVTDIYVNRMPSKKTWRGEHNSSRGIYTGDFSP
jgi:hypothetical protein